MSSLIDLFRLFSMKSRMVKTKDKRVERNFRNIFLFHSHPDFLKFVNIGKQRKDVHVVAHFSSMTPVTPVMCYFQKQ